MMPVVRIADSTLADLRTLSAWLGTNTPAETLDRAVRELMDRLGLERDDQPEAPITKDGAILFDTAPGLAFTKPLKATVNGKNIPSPRWSTIMLTLIRHLRAKGLDGQKLARELKVPARVGLYEEEGYTFHADLGISVQGQSAPDIWQEVDRLARKWGIPVTVEFWWRQNPKAHYPGRTGILKSGC